MSACATPISVALSGIAAPESFEGGLIKLGARIELAKRYTDHHRYSEAELQSFINRCIRRDLEMIVTTEKDAVRFPRLVKPEVPIFFSGSKSKFSSGHESWDHSSRGFASRSRCFRPSVSLRNR